LYGYSYDWILSGKEPKMLAGRGLNLTSLQRRIITVVEQMNENELRALLAFIETLKKVAIQPSKKQKAG
jgi:hypothetical protein